MSKQLDKLVSKALVELKGSNKGVGFAKVNGRKRDVSYVGPLEEKYSVHIEVSDVGKVVTLRHWGTITLVLNLDRVGEEVVDVYGIGNSDRDSVNHILSLFNIGYHVHYYPSTNFFELHSNKEDQLIQVA